MSGKEDDSTGSAVVRVERLAKVFRDFWRRPKVRAVDDISFEIRRGEIFGLLGPNGSGKSTTLKIMLGLLHPTSGSVEIFNMPPRDVAVKQRLGYLPEESYLYKHLNAVEMLDFYGRLFDIERNERTERIAQLIDMAGLANHQHRRVGEYSKGMARRIGIAQALINDPEFVILDEPTSGLDPIGRRQIKDLIIALAERGKTVLLASHLLADVEDVCDRIAILYNGKIRAIGHVKKLLEDRDRRRLTMDTLPPEAMTRIIEAIKKELGKEPTVDSPTRDLEQFFLQVVEDARRANQPARAPSDNIGIADYLLTREKAGKSADRSADPSRNGKDGPNA